LKRIGSSRLGAPSATVAMRSRFLLRRNPPKVDLFVHYTRVAPFGATFPNNNEDQEAMRISDLDYLNSVPETSALDLNGGGAVAIVRFSADAYGSATYTGTVVNNLAVASPYGSLAKSYVRVTAIASGDNTFVRASASSISSVS
jgi:hypothetical protein